MSHKCTATNGTNYLMFQVTVATNGTMDNYLRQSKDEGGGVEGEGPPPQGGAKRRASPGSSADNPEVKKRRSTRTNSSGAVSSAPNYALLFQDFIPNIDLF